MTALPGATGRIELYDEQTGRVEDTFDHPHGVRSLAYHPQGKALAVVGSGERDGSAEGVLRVRDLPTKKWRGASVSRPGMFGRVAYHPDGNVIALVYRDEKNNSVVEVRDEATLRLLHSLTDNFREIHDIGFARDGKIVAVGGVARQRPKGANSDGLVEVWDVTGKKPVFIAADLPNVKTVAFLPDGARLAVGCIGPARIIDTGTKTETLLPGADASESLAVSPDGTLLACGSHNRVQLVDVKSSVVTATLRLPFDHSVLAFRPDGKSLAVGTTLSGKTRMESAVSLWDVGSGRDSTAMAHSADYTGLAFAPDGKTVLTFGSNYADPDRRFLQLEGWDVATRRRVSNVPLKPPFPARRTPSFALSFRPDGKAIGAGRWVVDPTGAKDPVALSLPGIGEDSKLDRANPHGPVALALSRDGKLIAGVSTHGVVGFWDATDFKPLDTVVSPAFRNGGASSVAFGPDSKTVAVGRSRHDEKDPSVELWDATARKLLWSLTGATARLSPLSLAFSPDGKTLAVGGPKAGSDSKAWVVEFWDVAKGELQHTLDAPGGVGGMVFSPDGTLLAGACGKSLVLWEIKTRKIVREVPHNEQVVSVAFSRDGMIATASSYPGLRLWVVAELLAAGDRK